MMSNHPLYGLLFVPVFVYGIYFLIRYFQEQYHQSHQTTTATDIHPVGQNKDSSLSSKNISQSQSQSQVHLSSESFEKDSPLPLELAIFREEPDQCQCQSEGEGMRSRFNSEESYELEKRSIRRHSISFDHISENEVFVEDSEFDVSIDQISLSHRSPSPPSRVRKG